MSRLDLVTPWHRLRSRWKELPDVPHWASPMRSGHRRRAPRMCTASSQVVACLLKAIGSDLASSSCLHVCSRGSIAGSSRSG
jgi:hypothetical protein